MPARFAAAASAAQPAGDRSLRSCIAAAWWRSLGDTRRSCTDLLDAGQEAQLGTGQRTSLARLRRSGTSCRRRPRLQPLPVSRHPFRLTAETLTAAHQEERPPGSIPDQALLVMHKKRPWVVCRKRLPGSFAGRHRDLGQAGDRPWGRPNGIGATGCILAISAANLAAGSRIESTARGVRGRTRGSHPSPWR